MSLTTTRTSTRSTRLPLFRCLNNVGTRGLPIPVVGVVGKKTRTSGGISVRRDVVVPINTSSFSRKLHVYTRMCRTLGAMLGGDRLSATINSRNNFTPSLPSGRTTVRIVYRTMRGTNCATKGSVILTTSITTSRLLNSSKLCRLSKSRTTGATRRVVSFCRSLIGGCPVVSVRSNLKRRS